jgi:CubicO group peptidase (beta-lactamase class C family)
MGKTMRRLGLAAVVLAGLLSLPRTAVAAAPADLESGLNVTIGGVSKTLTLSEAMAALNVPSVSIALIDQDGIAAARAYGQGATPGTLFQAASLSKFVAAIGAMRLVDQQRLALDEDVNSSLTSWHVPANDLDKDHPVTLRGLLSMTAGIGVPGFLGYELGAPLPKLRQILDGSPPANSPPVTVIAAPGSAYHYSGGGYEIAEALMVDTLQAPFVEAMDETVLRPAEMNHSTFASLCRMSLGRRPRPDISPTGRKSKAATTSSPSMLPQDFGRRRVTSPISCSSLAGRGAEIARSFSPLRRCGRC